MEILLQAKGARRTDISHSHIYIYMCVCAPHRQALERTGLWFVGKSRFVYIQYEFALLKTTPFWCDLRLLIKLLCQSVFTECVIHIFSRELCEIYSRDDSMQICLNGTYKHDVHISQWLRANIAIKVCMANIFVGNSAVVFFILLL